MSMAVLALFLGFVAPVWATHTADPLEEEYSQHVLPYYNVGSGFASFAVFADTSFTDPIATDDTTTIHLFFFDKTCALQTDAIVKLTANDVEVVQLSSLSGIPAEGVIFADSGSFSTSDPDGERFLAYMILVNTVDNTLTRIDSIPFSRCLNDCNTDNPTSHWTRYDSFNTIAATFGDSTATTAGSIRTTLMFFNAIGGRPNKTPLGSIDTLREFMLAYGAPRAGDWVTTGASATSNVTPGQIELDAFDGNEKFLGSFRISPACFERVRLGSLIPVLASPLPGHVVAFSLPDFDRLTNCPDDGRCAFSGFQETTLEAGTVDSIFSGYFHHRCHAFGCE
jgi:hypothetical protein